MLIALCTVKVSEEGRKKPCFCRRSVVWRPQIGRDEHSATRSGSVTNTEQHKGRMFMRRVAFVGCDGEICSSSGSMVQMSCKSDWRSSAFTPIVSSCKRDGSGPNEPWFHLTTAGSPRPSPHHSQVDWQPSEEPLSCFLGDRGPKNSNKLLLCGSELLPQGRSDMELQTQRSWRSSCVSASE